MALTDYPTVDWSKPGDYPHATIPGRVLRIAHIPDNDSTPETIEELARDQGWAECTPEEQAEYRRQEQARIDGWQRGDWHYLGIGIVILQMRPGRTVPTTLGDAAVWGIESDCAPSEFAEIARDQYHEAEAEVAALIAALTTTT